MSIVYDYPNDHSFHEINFRPFEEYLIYLAHLKFQRSLVIFCPKGSSIKAHAGLIMDFMVFNSASNIHKIITLVFFVLVTLAGPCINEQISESSTNEPPGQSSIAGLSNSRGTKNCEVKLNKITGRILSLQNDDALTHRRSLMDTTIVLNYGMYFGYPKEDGTFEIDNLPPDSYVVEVNHPRFVYEPFRVDITSKTGKIRARRVNNLKPAEVITADYPLIFRPKNLHNYFLPRETWRIMDLILNPMVIMMVLPLLVIWVLPKMVNPQEVQSQQEVPQLPNLDVPELSELMANMFGRQPGAPGTGGQQSAVANAGGTSTSSGRHNNRVRRR